MKTLLLGANDGFWHAQDRAYERDVMSGIEAWVFAMDGDHCNTLEATPELINRYDIIIGNTNGTEYRPKLLELQQSRRLGIKWVSLIEGCATKYLAPDATTKKLFDGSDLINIINHKSLDFFRSWTTARCEYIGIPYPAANIRKQFPAGARRDVWTPSNLYTLQASYSSTLAALPVVERYGAKCHGFVRKPAKMRRSFKSGFRKIPQNTVLPGGGLLNAVVFHQEMGFDDYFRNLSQDAFAFVNIDHRYTWARNVLDCAALQIPCIATRSTGHGEIFFPELIVESEFSLREASELLERLYSDAEFYQRTAHVPMELLEGFSPEGMKKKLLATLGM